MNYIGLCVFFITTIKIIQMTLIGKTFKWLSSEPKEIDVKKGNYNVIVFGKVSNLKQARNLNFNVCDVNTRENIDVTPLSIPFSSLSNLKTFYRIAKFKLDTGRKIQVSIQGVENLTFTGSRLFLKNFLFPKRLDGRIYIGITKSFDFLLFLALVAANIASLFLVMW